jgi:hypothetical protein
MRTAALMIAATLALSWSGRAEDKTDTTVFKVDFNIHDGRDSAAKGGRLYSLVVRNNSKTDFKVGDRVPYATSASPQAGLAQYQYLDTGVNISCFARAVSDKVVIHAEVDLSTLAPNQRSSGVPNPTLAATHIVADVVLTPGQAASVGSFDDPVTTRKLDVEATVSKIN